MNSPFFPTQDILTADPPYISLSLHVESDLHLNKISLAGFTDGSLFLLSFVYVLLLCM